MDRLSEGRRKEGGLMEERRVGDGLKKGWRRKDG